MLKSVFQQECLKRGVLFSGSHNICFSHTNGDINYTLRVYNTALAIVGEALKKNNLKKILKGKPVEPVFRKA
jgi:glutamate-1-semialdehyde 2,1-aminomutase/spore coat polysaccharide biosynthesis protein SpsF